MTQPEQIPRWRHLDHDADIGVLGVGRTLNEAFEQAALAVTAIVTDAPVHDQERVTLVCRAPDDEMLLIDWLNALIYEMATRRMLFGRFSVSIDDHRLQGAAWGEPIDRERHQPTVEVKGATLTDLEVHRDTEGLWHARCVVDV